MELRRSIRIPIRFLRRLSVLGAAAVFITGIAAAAPALARPLVVVDPGHGGIYNHARYGTFLEKQANLLFAFELGRQLYAAGYDVRFTRTTDTAVTYADIPTWQWRSDQRLWTYAADGLTRYADGVPRDDLQARCDIANELGADIFISIHCNGSSSSAAHGTENFAASTDLPGQQLGRYVQAAVLEQTRQRDRGARVTDFYVLRWTNMPAILVETGFMSNPTEGARIANPSWRQSYVRGIVNGVNRWMATSPMAPIHERYAGSKRSESAVIASRLMFPNGAPAVLLASTLDIDSAVSAPAATARLSAPLLYTDARELTEATRAEMARLKPQRLIVLGSAVSEPLAQEAARAAGLSASAVTRLAGTEPLSVAPLLASDLYSADTSITVVFASGASMSDALAAALLAGTRGSALLLARADGSLPPETHAFLETRRARIIGATTVGTVPDHALGGLPGRSRVGSGQPERVFGAAVVAARPAGRLWLHAFDPASPVDSLTAVSAAAVRAGGVPVPVSGRYLSPLTREWLENNGPRVDGATVIGGHATLPPAVDHYLMKAIR